MKLLRLKLLNWQIAKLCFLACPIAFAGTGSIKWQIRSTEEFIDMQIDYYKTLVQRERNGAEK